jgi:transposase
MKGDPGMATEYFIALDTHCAFTDFAAASSKGDIVRRESCATTIPELVEAIERVRRPRYLTFEEGPLADWLSRHLRTRVDRLVVCEPRRNGLIAKDGDKDDPIDAEKLAQLFRGGYLKEVHQSGTLERSLLKQHVGFYHDRVRERVRQGHQLVALLRRHGVFASIDDVADPEQRKVLWRRLPTSKLLRDDLHLLLEVYETLLSQEDQIRQELVRLARREEPVRRFVDVPGIAWIRALTFYVYVDTPRRFEHKSALWRYCGIGLVRKHSGSGRTKTALDCRGHRRLKDVVLGAAKSASSQANNPFADKYRYWTREEGMHPSTARRNVARALATTLWSLWKTGDRYDPAKVRGVGQPAAEKSPR